MSRIDDDAIILARHDFSETSQVIVLFTQSHGKIRAIAKGVKRGTKARFAVGIDLLDIGHVMAARRSDRGDGLFNVTEWKQTRCLAGLRDRLCRIHAAQYTIEVTNVLTQDGDPHVALFDALLFRLNELSVAAEPFGVLIEFQLDLLLSIGSIPRFDACVLCNRADQLTHFSSHEGGMVCNPCASAQQEKHSVSLTTYQICAMATERMRHAAQASGRAADALMGDSAIGPFRLLNYHISHLMGREPVLVSKLLRL